MSTYNTLTPLAREAMAAIWRYKEKEQQEKVVRFKVDKGASKSRNREPEACLKKQSKSIL